MISYNKGSKGRKEGMYYLVLTSLPRLPDDFQRPGRAPVSRYRLAERLAPLRPAARQAALDFLHWLAADDDPAVVAGEAALLPRLDPPAREFVQGWSGCLYLAALARSRRLQQPLPPPVQAWQDLARPTEAGIGRRFPWRNRLEEHLQAGEVLAAVRLVHGRLWQLARRTEDQHPFSLAAVLAYLGRWHLVTTWFGRDQDKALTMTRTMLEEAVADHVPG